MLAANGTDLAKNVVTVRGLDAVAETGAITSIAPHAVSTRAGGQFCSAACLCSPEQPLAASSNPSHSAMPLSIEPGAVQAAGATMAEAMATGRAAELVMSMSFASANANFLEVLTTCALHVSEPGFVAKSRNLTESSSLAARRWEPRRKGSAISCIGGCDA